MVKWLWLEEERNSISDIEHYLRSNEIEYELFTNLDQIYKKLIFLKEKGKLNEYGLILDIKIEGTLRVPIPKEWAGEYAYTSIKVTNQVNNTGLQFYQHAIANKASSFWSPLPPVIFLTTVNATIFAEIIEDFKVNNEKIAYIRKWDYDKPENNFLKNLREW